MMSRKITAILLVCLISLTTQEGNTTGTLWTCDDTVLASYSQCIFVRTDGDSSGPHNFDRSIAADGFRTVINSAGTEMTLSGRPAGNCDTIIETDVEKTGDDLVFVKIFEIMAVVQDYAMFAPDDVDKTWEEITKSITDCGVKQESYLDGKPNEIYYNVADIKDMIVSPGGTDIHNDVLKFLEEAQNELMCIATSTGSWDNMGHCDAFRLAKGLDEGESDDCWVDGYNSMALKYNPNYNKIVEVDVCGATESSGSSDTIIDDSATEDEATEDETPEDETPESDDSSDYTGDDYEDCQLLEDPAIQIEEQDDQKDSQSVEQQVEGHSVEKQEQSKPEESELLEPSARPPPSGFGEDSFEFSPEDSIQEPVEQIQEGPIEKPEESELLEPSARPPPSGFLEDPVEQILEDSIQEPNEQIQEGPIERPDASTQGGDGLGEPLVVNFVQKSKRLMKNPSFRRRVLTTA